MTAAVPWQSRSLTMFPSSQFGFYGRRGLVVAAWEGRFFATPRRIASGAGGMVAQSMPPRASCIGFAASSGSAWLDVKRTNEPK